MRVHVVDPSAFAPPYDHELCAGLARAGAAVELVTSDFAYGPVPAPAGYVRRRAFYRRVPPRGRRRLRQAVKLAQHGPDMLRYRALAARAADIVHFQWLPVEAVDQALLPAGPPLVLTAHEVLPRGARPGQAWGRRRLYERVDAVVAHTSSGRERLIALGLDPARVALIPHGVFDYLAHQPAERPLPPELAAVEGPVVLCLGVWRPYHGIDVLLEAWRGIRDAELWVVGLPKMPTAELMRDSPPGVRFLPRFVTDPELPAFFRRADLVVMPYRAIEASGVLFSALAFGRPTLATAVGGFLDAGAVGAAALVPPEDPGALHAALARLLGDAGARDGLAAGARAAAAGPYSWDAIARETLALYERLLAAQ